MTLTTVSQNQCFGGVQGVYSHASPETGCTMRFGLFLPPQAKEGLVPVLYWLSGLTCTEENFIVKAGAQRVAAELGIAIPTITAAVDAHGAALATLAAELAAAYAELDAQAEKMAEVEATAAATPK